jgi:ribosomal protein S18 acetylase RimI-like enzyme
MIRKLKQADAPIIEKFLGKVKAFSKSEVGVAMELVNSAANNPKQTDYNVFVYVDSKNILGYYCAGKRPLTDAVYDLYWIVTNPEHPKKGIGKMLLTHAEKFVLSKNARWLLAETSSTENYAAARNFYLRNHYSIIAEINNFYAVGDNLMVFGKYFSK